MRSGLLVQANCAGPCGQVVVPGPLLRPAPQGRWLCGMEADTESRAALV